MCLCEWGVGVHVFPGVCVFVCVWGGGGGGGGCTNEFWRMEGFNYVLYFYKLFVLECIPVYILHCCL